MKFHFDHLVIAATTLAQGVAQVEQLLGVAPRAGGQHGFMGTHNALLRLGDSCYLEVIAIDPSLPAPPRPRWFGLDDPALRHKLAISPRLIHWVVRTNEISSLPANVAQITGPAVAASRGNLHWKITIPYDGAMPLHGIFPTIIQWNDAEHVASKMPDLGCRLQQLVVSHPKADFVRSALVMDADTRIQIEAGPVAKLTAAVTTPTGQRKLY